MNSADTDIPMTPVIARDSATTSVSVSPFTTDATSDEVEPVATCRDV